MRLTARTIVIATGLAIMAMVSAGAQSSAHRFQVDSGIRVKVWRSDSAAGVGRLLSAWSGGEPLRYCSTTRRPCDGATDSARIIVVPVQAIQRVAVRRGDHGFIGLLVGAVAGVALASGTNFACDTRSCGGGVRYPVVLSGMVFGVLGYLVGDHLGHWQTVR
ncbi:MAG TPA: hypothetical protein VGM77_06290 [Gemmatimonadales bacterium]|jgi:hypothetical protein